MGAPFVDAATNQAVKALHGALVGLPYAAIGPILEVVFPVANTRRDLPHGLGQVPDGYHVLLQSGGVLTATDVALWTPQVAWLMASANNTRARLIFFTLHQGVIAHVVP